MRRICSIEGCGNQVHGRGWCNKHYCRWQKSGDPLAVSKTLPGVPKEWLLAHVGHEGEECLIWPFAGAESEQGYGRIHWDGKMDIAHRVMCTLVNGNPPSDTHQTAHKCGRGHLGCIHPKHLRWATPEENSADRLLHGTHLRGTRHKLAKLSEADIPLIIADLQDRKSFNSIAIKFGVSAAAISSIARGKSWGWLSGLTPTPVPQHQPETSHV